MRPRKIRNVKQSELLGEGGEDEVGGALGDELQVGLRAGHEPLAGEAAGADRDHPLDDVETFAERVGRGVEQGAHALLLVVVQHAPVDAGLAQRVAG
jgi:hypothetical protein